MESTVTPWGGPVWLFKLMLPVGASLLLLQGIAEFIKNIMQLTTKES
jgi:TRAP-type mannitol/chloroaromatic compound transport system permease small subunit